MNKHLDAETELPNIVQHVEIALVSRTLQRNRDIS